jgi:small nuclear ribonucleoprotein (snRNP)-like protein
MLEAMVDKVVQVVTNDGRNIVGLLKGFDQTTNVILDECHERVFSSSAGVEQVWENTHAPSIGVARHRADSSGFPRQVVLGLYIVRGDNMCAPRPSTPARFR